MDPQELVGWLDLLDVGLEYVSNIRLQMNSGTPATKEEFAKLRADFMAEHDRVMGILDNMPPAGTLLLSDPKE